MQRFQSPNHFPLSSILDDALPAEDLPKGENMAKHVATIQKACEDRGIPLAKVTFDTSTSKSRHPEWAFDVLTCVRPSHKIWAFGAHRHVRGHEMLLAHGLYANEFKNPDAILSMEPALAHDIAGNAFTTSILIAKVLATMVNGQAWEKLADVVQTASAGLLGAAAKRQMTSGHGESGEPQTAGSSATPQAHPSSEKPPKKQKKSILPTRGKKRNCPEQPEPNDPGQEPEPEEPARKSKKTGKNLKGGVLTIAKKMEILAKYEELQQKNVKHPEKDRAPEEPQYIEYV